MEKLTFAYLGEWIALQKADRKAGKEGAEGKLASAIHLKDQLESIVEGEPPHDLFVGWKPLLARSSCRLGNRISTTAFVLNIRPFMNAVRRFMNVEEHLPAKEPKIKMGEGTAASSLSAPSKTSRGSGGGIRRAATSWGAARLMAIAGTTFTMTFVASVVSRSAHGGLISAARFARVGITGAIGGFLSSAAALLFPRMETPMAVRGMLLGCSL